jgi:hypothetical protein
MSCWSYTDQRPGDDAGSRVGLLLVGATDSCVLSIASVWDDASACCTGCPWTGPVQGQQF